MEIIPLEDKIKKTEAVINNIFKLHAIPQVLREILNYLNTESINNSTLTKLILKDQNLVTKVLAISNSPLYGLQRNVTTVDFALMVLGVEEIRHIVSSLCMMDAFKNKSDEYLDHKNFWEHSFLVGSVAKKIAEDLNLKFSGEVFTAGFLHDLGVPVIHKYFHSSFTKIVNEVKNNSDNILQLEIETIGLNHAEIAYKLLDKWNLPIVLCDCVRYHYMPLKSRDYKKQTAVVHLADYIIKYLETGSFFWDFQLKLDTDAVELLGFANNDQLYSYINSFTEFLPKQLDSMRDLV
jgi:putative nucleotidyltransferase with HDIG domain